MMRRDIQQKIALVNREMDQTFARAELPQSRQYMRFPKWIWLLCAAALLWWKYGVVVADWHRRTASASYVAGIVLGAVALWLSVVWILNPKPDMASRVNAQRARIRQLEKQRAELMKQLEEADDK